MTDQGGSIAQAATGEQAAPAGHRTPGRPTGNTVDFWNEEP